MRHSSPFALSASHLFHLHLTVEMMTRSLKVACLGSSQAVMEAQASIWQSGAFRNVTPSANGTLPFFRASITDVQMDMAKFERSGATYMQFDGSSIQADDLRLAYSKVMTDAVEEERGSTAPGGTLSEGELGKYEPPFAQDDPYETENLLKLSRESLLRRSSGWSTGSGRGLQAGSGASDSLRKLPPTSIKKSASPGVTFPHSNILGIMITAAFHLHQAISFTRSDLPHPNVPGVMITAAPHLHQDVSFGRSECPCTQISLAS